MIIQGSGTSSRGNGWYLTLAKNLQDNGIAVLLPDKRESEQSQGDSRWLARTPVGSRTHIRSGLLISRINSNDARLAGWMTVEGNANLDANFEGPVWGTFSIAVDSGGTWEGTWQDSREAEDSGWTATLNVHGRGYGGAVDGMKLMAVEQIFTPMPLPLAYIGHIEGRIIDPN